MSYSTLQYIQAKLPALYADANLAVYVSSAELSIDSSCYGVKYNYAVALKACHDYSVTQLQQGAGAGSTGTVVSKTEGDLSITFGNNFANMSGDQYLRLTNFGLELLSLQKGTIARFSVTGETQSEPTYIEL